MSSGGKIVVAALVALVVGLVSGRLSAPGKVPPAVDPKVVPAAAVVVADDQQEILQSQIAALEHELALRLDQIAELQRAVAARDSRPAPSVVAGSEAGSGEEPERRPRRPREDAAARMERMRTENPEAFAEMEQRRSNMQQRMAELHQDRQAFLEAVDTSRMSAAQRENHEKLLVALAAANEFRLQMSSGNWGEMNDEERAAGFQALRNIGELYEQERRYILEETGRAYGEDGTQFADYMENVIENTSLLPSMGRMGFGGGGRGGDGNRPQRDRRGARNE